MRVYASGKRAQTSAPQSNVVPPPLQSASPEKVSPRGLKIRPSGQPSRRGCTISSFFEVFRMCKSAESVAKYQAALVGDVCLRRSVLLPQRLAVGASADGKTVGRILVIDTFSSMYENQSTTYHTSLSERDIDHDRYS
jgi:hypothetical protein